MILSHAGRIAESIAGENYFAAGFFSFLQFSLLPLAIIFRGW
jgi:hypothetical protein